MTERSMRVEMLRRGLHETPSSPSETRVLAHCPIPLQFMPQQIGVDIRNDWTGVSDRKERKKMQDRINQKIYRKLLLSEQLSLMLTAALRMTSKGQRKKIIEAGSTGSRNEEENISSWNGCPGSHQPNTEFSPVSSVSRTRSPHDMGLDTFNACDPDSKQTELFILQFTRDAHEKFRYGSLHADMLINLVQFNTTSALVGTARLMGITRESMTPGSRSKFTSSDFSAFAYGLLPPSLQPTQLQITVPHHPWIDILPFPEIRDNLLRVEECSYDEMELCRDLRGFQTCLASYSGIVVWGDPWDFRNWEITDAFEKKWPWVVKYCPMLQESTKNWRNMRENQTF